MGSQMFEDTLMIEDDYVRPSERSGMGIVLNEKALAPHRAATCEDEVDPLRSLAFA